MKKMCNTKCKACKTGNAEFCDSEDGGMWIRCSEITCTASTMIYYSCGEDARPIMLEQWETGKNLEFLGGDIVDFTKAP